MHTVGEKTKKLIGLLLPFLAIALWPVSYFHRLSLLAKPRKRVLLVARNSVAADHMICICELLKSGASVQQFVTTDRFPTLDFDRHNAKSIVGAESVHIFWALVCHWDLIVFTNHPYGLGVCFPPWLKKLYVNHGIHSGKINNELAQDGVYGQSKVIRPFGKPYYDCIFAASSWEKDFAVRETPLLEGRIAVTGFLRADLFLDYAKHNAEAARERFGLPPDMKVVHIVSTWGKNSLYATCGDVILNEVSELRDKYSFVVSIHPRFDDLGDGALGSRETIFAKFEAAGARVNRYLDWEDYVAISDVAIADHSSLALYHVLLNHRLVFAKVMSDQYVDGSTFDRLSHLCPRLSQYADLDEAITDSLTSQIENKILEIGDSMLDFRGSAKQRYLEEIGVLLDESR